MALDIVLAYLRGVPAPPDMITANLGNIHFARREGGAWGEDVIPMGFNDAARLLGTCYELGIVPEPAILDLSWINTAVWFAREGQLRSTRYFMSSLATRRALSPPNICRRVPAGIIS
jgi:hypothetical protein